MKVNNVQQYSVSYNNQCDYKNKKQASPSFGSGSLAVTFWDSIARGGFAASFTVQDMAGTNFPRTYQALQRNKDLTGENNYKAAAEVAIREFTTGPSMCAIPIFVLAGAKKLSGSANEVPIEHIEAFSNEMKGVMKGVPITETTTVEGYAKDVKANFYEKMFKMALTTGEMSDKEKQIIEERAKRLAGLLQQYDEAPSRNFIKQFFDKKLIQKGVNGAPDVEIKAKDQIFSEIIHEFSDAKKKLTTDYTTLLSSDMNGTLKPKSISSLVKDFSNFGNDAVTTLQKESKDGGLASLGIKYSSFMDEFKKRRVGSKFLTNVLMVGATSLFIVQIPKMYTLHKTNPETDVFRLQEQQGSEVKNVNK